MSKYPWHPATRPPPAPPSVAANIALIGRVGKCLQAALDEIQKEDDDLFLSAADDEVDSISGKKRAASALLDDSLSDEELSCSSSIKKRKRADSCDGSLEPAKKCDADTSDKNKKTSSDTLKMDKSMAKSIMEAYGKAVATTNFDPESDKTINTASSNSKDSNRTITAPAAMLCGEIDHYNRIGDRWRIVLKNASIKPRKTTIITNGMTGLSLRRRMVLDWDDEGNDDGRDHAQVDGGGEKESGAYHFKGKLQILAYDDDV